MQQTKQAANSPRGLPIIGLIIGAVLLVFAVAALFSSYTVVNSGSRGVVKTFGQITSVLSEGLHFRPPFVSTVTSVDIRTQRHESKSSAASRDLQIVATQVVLNYRPESSSVDTLVREIGIDYVSIIVEPAVQESVKAAAALFTAEELITQRSKVSQSIREALMTRLQPRGIVVEDLSITEFNFSEEFAKAIESKQVAEQDALRAERELRRAQIESQQQVARADAEAKARLTVARAEAEGLRLQREVISPDLLQLRFIEKWDGVLPRFNAGAGGIMPMLNIPTEALASESTPAPTTPAPDTNTQPSN